MQVHFQGACLAVVPDAFLLRAVLVVFGYGLPLTALRANFRFHDY